MSSLRQIQLPTCLAAMLLIASGCGSPKTAEATIDNSPDSISVAKFAASLDVDLAKSEHDAAGLYWRDLKIGTGPEAGNGDSVSVHYDGRLPDGSRFDASTDKLFSFRLGVGRVIAGWDRGVAGMKVGGTRQLIIPPQLGYGARGSGPIPPDAVLVFTVDLVAIN